MTKRIEYKEKLAEAAKKAAGDLSIPTIAYKTGISYETVRKMIKFGHVPSEDMLERFAEGLGADLQELRIAAGYEQPSDTPGAVEVALRNVQDLAPESKDELMRIVKEFAEKHRKKNGE